MIEALDGVPVEHRRIALATSGVHGPLSLHVALAGPPDGAPVILLHGFPEFWVGWRHQIPALARAGYRVIVPDQRGYAASDKPDGWRPYRVQHLVDDVVGLQDALCGGAPTHIVGHDWGGGVAWVTAMVRPDRVRTLSVLNCPRPRVLQRCLWSNPRQLAKSWYMLFFQLPWLPERRLAGGWVEAIFRGSARPGTFTDDEIATYARAADVPSMRAALGWYRAALRDPGPDGPIRAPTLLLWGNDDRALGAELAEPSLQTAADSRLAWLHGGTHWVQHDRAERVNAELLAHLGAHGGPDPLVYKIAPSATWAAVDDAWEGAPIDRTDGFVHLSAAHQVQGTLDKHFVGQGGLLLLGVDPARLPPGALRWEVSRGGARFPHLYGRLPRSAVVSERPIPLPHGQPTVADMLATVAEVG